MKKATKESSMMSTTIKGGNAETESISMAGISEFTLELTSDHSIML